MVQTCGLSLPGKVHRIFSHSNSSTIVILAGKSGNMQFLKTFGNERRLIHTDFASAPDLSSNFWLDDGHFVRQQDDKLYIKMFAKDGEEGGRDWKPFITGVGKNKHKFILDEHGIIKYNANNILRYEYFSFTEAQRFRKLPSLDDSSDSDDDGEEVIPEGAVAGNQQADAAAAANLEAGAGADAAGNQNAAAANLPGGAEAVADNEQDGNDEAMQVNAVE